MSKKSTSPSFHRDGPLFYEADELEAEGREDQFDETPLVSPNQRSMNESRFWPASSQISLGNGSLYDETIMGKPRAEATTNGYEELQRDQAAQTQRGFEALKAVDAYLQKPAKAASNNPLQDLLREGPILPIVDNGIGVVQHEPKDTLFRTAFAILTCIMFLIGIVIAILFPSELTKLRGPSLYRVLIESSKTFSSVAAISIACAIVWAALLQRFTRGLVYGMIGFVPASCLAVGIWAAFEAAHGDTGGLIAHLWLIMLCIGSLGAALFSTLIIGLHQKTIRQSVMITKMAANILLENPSVYFSSLIIVILYVAYVAIWTSLFAHLTLLGHVATIKGPSLIKEWQLSSWSYVLQGFFLAMLLWTTSVFSNLQKATIAGVVSRWYFFHDHPEYAKMRFEGLEALRAPANSLSGQICLGALIISTARAMKFSFWVVKKGLQQVSQRWAQASLGTLNTIIGFLERVVEHVTEFSIYQASLTGESLFKSGRTVTRLFRRNATLGVTMDFVAQMILKLSTLSIAGFCSLASYTFASHALHSQYGWAMSILFGLLSWYILRFFAAIYADTMDVAFLCCIIDLDQERNRCPAVHQAFAAKPTRSE